MGKPSIILTSQFTVPSAKSFTNYLKYMTRKNALLDKEKKLSDKEKVELNKIDALIEAYDMENGITYSSIHKESDEKEIEASKILKSKSYFNDNDKGFEKYIKYMSRQYALEKKKNKTYQEKKELEIVKSKISDFIKIEKEDFEEKEHLEYIPGVFSIYQEKMEKEDIKEVIKIVGNAQKNGSVFYQDVISFDNDFLIKEGIYNQENNELDEQRLQYASRKMMEKLFDDEKIDSGFWFASIHRNTKHIHIHFGTVETQNTRPLINVIDKDTGIEYMVPKGKRKKTTIDNMKSTFVNALVDRTSELSRISQLRNTLVEDIKLTYKHNKNELEHEQIKLLEEIYHELPSNKKYWQYGSKYLSDNTRKKIDILTNSLMVENPNFQEYVFIIKNESNYRKELFGESERAGKDYETNKLKDIQKRLGNSLLKVMKNDSDRKEKFRNVYRLNKNIENKAIPADNVLITSKNIYRIKRALYDDYQKYRAQKDYEYLQERIANEQKRNTL